MERMMISASLPWSDGTGPVYENQYTDLASAIVFQAVKDYMKILKSLWNKGLSRKRKRALIIEKAEIEDFFHSGWYEFLTDLDPDVILNGCRQRAMEQEKERLHKQNIRKIKQLQKKEVTLQ